jgi:hypothetical protein
MNDLSRVAFLALIICAIVLIPYVLGKYDRERIREQVESTGGTVIDIDHAWFGGGRNLRQYRVTYKTRDGKRHTEKCVTSMMRGVHWLSDRPPGSGREIDDKHQIDEHGIMEPIECLQCGVNIPREEMKCPHCGWSYKAARAGK